MSTPPGNYDSLDAIDAASVPIDQAAAPTDQAATPGTPPATIVWGTDGEPRVSMEGFYITPDDSTQVTVWNSNPALTSLTVQLRVLRPDGTLVIEAQTIPNLTSNRAPNTAVFEEMEGFIVGAVIGPPGVALVRGSTYVNLAVIRGAVAAPLQSLVLIADYVTSSFQPGWPFGRVLAAVESHGRVYAVSGSLPAAGQPAVLTQPTNTRWRVQSLFVDLVTSAVAGNRTVKLAISPPGGSIVLLTAPAVQAASTLIDYNAAPTLPWVVMDAATQSLPLPVDLVTPAGTSFQWLAGGIQAGDQFSAVTAMVEEWLDV